LSAVTELAKVVVSPTAHPAGGHHRACVIATGRYRLHIREHRHAYRIIVRNNSRPVKGHPLQCPFVAELPVRREVPSRHLAMVREGRS
jgi:hypothetical protein